MATGRSTQLTKQVGEYLVASELARRGFVVATFSGNVPDYDLIVTNSQGNSCPIQVKTIKGRAWQFSIEKFVDISFDGNKQIVGNKKLLAIPDLIWVCVVAAKKYGDDQFFLLEWQQVQDILIANYKYWLDSHAGVRPKNPNSLHCAMLPSDLIEYKDNWSLIDDRL